MSRSQAIIQEPLYTVNSVREIATTKRPQLLNPKEFPPPIGVDILYIQQGSLLIRGRLRAGECCAAWMALPSLPEWVHENIREHLRVY